MALISPSGLDLATIPNHRRSRFHGESRCCDLSDFADDEVLRLRALYLAVARIDAQVSSAQLEAIAPTLGAEASEELRDLVAAASAPRGTTRRRLLRGVLHDTTGGSLTVLIWTLSGALGAPDWGTVRFLAADHLKIMRNAIVGLDEERRRRDQEGGLHGVRYLRERWSNAQLQNDRGRVEIAFVGDTDTSFAENCFEFSTVQRIIYSLLSNACEHTADQRVDFQVSDAQNGASGNVRFVVANAVETEHASRLRDLADDKEPFREGFSTSGGGLGLGICADLVQAA